jgi:hypothetical protein
MEAAQNAIQRAVVVVVEDKKSFIAMASLNKAVTAASGVVTVSVCSCLIQTAAAFRVVPIFARRISKSRRHGRTLEIMSVDRR